MRKVSFAGTIPAARCPASIASGGNLSAARSGGRRRRPGRVQQLHKSAVGPNALFGDGFAVLSHSLVAEKRGTGARCDCGMLQGAQIKARSLIAHCGQIRQVTKRRKY